MHAFLSDSLKIINTQQFLKAMKVRESAIYENRL